MQLGMLRRGTITVYIFRPSTMTRGHHYIPHSRSTYFLNVLMNFLRPPPRTRDRILSRNHFLTRRSRSGGVRHANDHQRCLPINLWRGTRAHRGLLSYFRHSIRRLFAQYPRARVVRMPSGMPCIRRFLSRVIRPLRGRIYGPL